MFVYSQLGSERKRPVVALLGCVGLLLAAPAHAFPAFRSNFFTAYPGAVGTRLDDLNSNGNHCGVCHYNFNGGGPRNPYGAAVEATNRSPAAILGLGGLDSDGDGFTNDEEITDFLTFSNTPTFPGLADVDLALTSNLDTTEIEDFLTPGFLITHDEVFDGDLSDDRLLPTVLTFADGDNTVRAAQQGNAFGRDIDYFTFTIPTGFQLESLFVDDFVADPGNLAFLGIQTGTVFTVDASTAQASDLLGGAVFGATDIGNDILPTAGTLFGSTGFTPPLQAGDYTIWLNQTGPPSEATLTFFVPEPGTPSLLAAGAAFLALLAGRRRM